MSKLIQQKGSIWIIVKVNPTKGTLHHHIIETIKALSNLRMYIKIQNLKK
ncbi:hypothetical protein IR128_07370 [Staphylococcus lentus]|nr:hypothetical protein [Mammaliicoccus lentus]MBF0841520.1 hypothetical protein [Mammaliicoccus lentus]